MKKRLFFNILSITISLICLSSCVLPTSMYENGMEDHDFDFDAVGELVQNYITEKYEIDCELTHGTVISYAGDKYVEAKFKTSGDDNEYIVTVYPETDEDSDGDGYYDSYYIESDGYFTIYIQPMVRDWINDLAEKNVGFNDYLVFASLHYEGYIKDFNVPESIDQIISKGNEAGVFLYIIIPEDEYSDDARALEEVNGLVEYLKSTNMDCWGKLEVYDREKYEKVSQYQTYQDYNNNIRKYFGTATLYLFK